MLKKGTPASPATVHPLEPPDRSSPRATLQSFITHMNAAQRAVVDDGLGARDVWREVGEHGDGVGGFAAGLGDVGGVEDDASGGHDLSI